MTDRIGGELAGICLFDFSVFITPAYYTHIVLDASLL